MSQQQFVFSRKFQAKLVRVLFQFPDEGRDILEHIEPRHFDSSPMRWAVEKMKRSTHHLGVPATETVLEHEAIKDARQGVIPKAHIPAYGKFLGRINKVVPDKSYILKEAHDYIRHVSLRDFVINAGEALHKGKVNWDSIERDMSRHRQLGSCLEGGMGSDYFDNVKRRCRLRKRVELDGVPTGLPIDRSFRQRGLPHKQLGVIMAPTGRGKTAMLAYLSGSAALANYNVLYVSCELESSHIEDRLDSRLTGIALNKLVSKEKLLRRKLKAVQKAGIGKMHVKYFPPATLTIAGLKLYVSRLESRGFYPGLIALDYADNMSLKEFRGAQSDQDYGPLGRLYVGLRGLAGELNVAMWTASQTNRMAMDKQNLGLEDLADSFRKAAVADAIVGIAQTKSEQKKMAARLVLLKNRNGAPELDGYGVKFNPATVQITT